MLGCCKLDGDLCIVMSLYPKSAAKHLHEASGQSCSQSLCYSCLVVLFQLHRTPVLISLCYIWCKTLNLNEVIAIVMDILEGLSQLHDANILHLDLKPGNVLLDSFGHAYLSDFGISHVLRTLDAFTALTNASGTPHFM